MTVVESLTGVRLFDITEWGNYRFDEGHSTVLSLSALAVEHPHPIGFGSSSEVNRWLDKERIAWMVASADDPSAINATAAIWRPRRSNG